MRSDEPRAASAPNPWQRLPSDRLPPRLWAAVVTVGDGWVVVLAAGAAVGAWASRPVPLVAAIVLAVIGRWRRWPVVLVVGVALMTSTLAARALGASSLPPGPFRARVTLVSDPVPLVGRGTEADVRAGHRRLQVWAFSSAGRALARAAAGDTIVVTGTAVTVTRPRRLLERHLLGRVDAISVEHLDDGAPWARAANRVRAIVERGATSLPMPDRALFTGFVLGDDRAVPAVVVDEFRASGLSHLTAVSGENVAFVLAALAPALRRLTLRPRLLATLVVLVFFSAVTRFEPSVLRAVVMAGLAAIAAFIARPTSGVRLVALAVTLLLVADPLLVHSVGFGLSVGASAAIVLLARPLAARLPGPRFVIEPLAVTVAAQIGVLPVSLIVFGGVPIAAIPANLLAAPAAGPVMTWGLTGGLVAGIAPRPLASVLHAPTRVLVRWIAVVAHWGSRWPLGTIGLPVVVVAAAVCAVCMLARLAVFRR